MNAPAWLSLQLYKRGCSGDQESVLNYFLRNLNGILLKDNAKLNVIRFMDEQVFSSAAVIIYQSYGFCHWLNATKSHLRTPQFVQVRPQADH